MDMFAFIESLYKIFSLFDQKKKEKKSLTFNSYIVMTHES